MKHLILVSVAMGTFSGTSITATAQTVGTRAVKTSSKFIESIELRPEARVSAKSSSAIKDADRIIPVNAEDETDEIEKCSLIQFKYAQLLNTDVEAVSNAPLYSFIEKWWATPYRYGGATRDGIDCSAYSGTLFHHVYATVLSRTARAQYQDCEKIKKKDLQEGDLVFFRTRRGVSHVGVYLQNGYFTHASTSSGVMISRLDESYFSKRYIGGGRIAVKKIEQ